MRQDDQINVIAILVGWFACPVAPFRVVIDPINQSVKCCVYFFKIRLGLKILAPSRKVLEREIFQSGVGAPMLIFCYLICELRSIFWLGIIWNLEKEIKSDFGVGLAWSWYNCKQFNFNIKLFCCIMFST